MSLYDSFYLLLLITIILTRILVFVFNKTSPTIKGFRTHHWMFGLLFTVILFVLSNFFKNVYLLAISMGIFFDEIGFILIKGKTHEDNYSPKSFMIIMIFLLLLFVFRECIIVFYLNL